MKPHEQKPIVSQNSPVLQAYDYAPMKAAITLVCGDLGIRSSGNSGPLGGDDSLVHLTICPATGLRRSLMEALESVGASTGKDMESDRDGWGRPHE